MRPRFDLSHYLTLGAIGAFGAYLVVRDRLKKGEAPSEGSGSGEKPALSQAEVEGVREYTHPTPAGYTRAIPQLPPEANSFARQALGKPYGTVIGPAVLSDGKTYIAVTESHFDDHVTNPRTGQKDKHWHKGASMFMRVS